MAPWLSLRPVEPVIQGLAFGLKGKLLAACSRGGRVHVWELPSGRRLHAGPLQGPVTLEGLAFSPDGRLLAGVGRTEVVVWDVKEGEEVLTLTGAPPRRSDAGFSPRIAWSPDGRRLAATNWDHTVSIWDGADQSRKDVKNAMRKAARERLPAFHIENASRAWQKGQHFAVDYHLRQVERLGPLAPGWRLERGSLLAQRGEWAKAAADYAAALEGESGAQARVWCEHALLQARAGKLDVCRQVREMLPGRIGPGTGIESLAHLIQACSVLPDGGKQADHLARLAAKPPLGDNEYEAGAWYTHVRGIAALRPGDMPTRSATANGRSNETRGRRTRRGTGFCWRLRITIRTIRRRRKSGGTRRGRGSMRRRRRRPPPGRRFRRGSRGGTGCGWNCCAPRPRRRWSKKSHARTNCPLGYTLMGEPTARMVEIGVAC